MFHLFTGSSSVALVPLRARVVFLPHALRLPPHRPRRRRTGISSSRCVVEDASDRIRERIARIVSRDVGKFVGQIKPQLVLPLISHASVPRLLPNTIAPIAAASHFTTRSCTDARSIRRTGVEGRRELVLGRIPGLRPHHRHGDEPEHDADGKQNPGNRICTEGARPPCRSRPSRLPWRAFAPVIMTALRRRFASFTSATVSGHAAFKPLARLWLGPSSRTPDHASTKEAGSVRGLRGASRVGQALQRTPHPLAA